MSDRYVCVHGHFYQPPRENPWLDAVEVQDSAHPMHDWNERVTDECYAPNARSRILDGEGFIERIVNNYERISFDFGPTLLSWLERAAPDVYGAILQADIASRERFGGHGSAMAQVHSHLIMPLANTRDRHTQVVWGVRDFLHRFGRRPEGMWLAETAVDTPSLEALAEQGIAFTVLAPHQARRVRALTGGDWRDVDAGSLDTGQAYRADLPSGRTIALFFYDGPLSQAVAFERVLADGGEFARRLTEAVPGGEGARLAHIATDGETYGHHHRFGDMALAFALEQLETGDSVELTNYGQFLAEHPPTQAVEIVEASSWSCAHGVERWRSNCGCNSGGHPSWNQGWRRPLREAFDWLRDALAERYEDAGATLFVDPWAARDAYIELTFDFSARAIELFLTMHGRVARDDSTRRSRALKLLAMQEQAVLMFASCAWFFDDIAGIEGIQGLLHAGRALQLAQELFPDGDAIARGFFERLSQARSNDPAAGDGADVFRRHVLPVQVDLRRAAAHFAVNSLFRSEATAGHVGPYVIEPAEFALRETGSARLAQGWASVASERTLEMGEFVFTALHLGDQNVAGGVLPRAAASGFEAMMQSVATAFDGGDFGAATRQIDTYFPADAAVSIRSLFRDEQRRVMAGILEPVLTDAEEAYRRLYDDHVSLLRFLVGLDYPIPNRLRTAAQYALEIALRRGLGQDDVDAARVRSILEEASLAGVGLASEALTVVAQAALDRAAATFAATPADADCVGRLRRFVELLPALSFEVKTWGAQNAFYAVVNGGETGLPKALRPDIEAIGRGLRVRLRPEA